MSDNNFTYETLLTQITDLRKVIEVQEELIDLWKRKDILNESIIVKLERIIQIDNKE